MTPRQRSALYRAVLEERDKIGIERKIEYIDNDVEKYDAQAVASPTASRGPSWSRGSATSKRWLVGAISYGEQTVKMIERTRAVERMLQRLTELELRQLRQAA